MADAILRLPAVKARTGLSRSSIYPRIAEGDFPAQISLGANSRAVGFLEREIAAWVDAQIERRKNTKSAT